VANCQLGAEICYTQHERWHQREAARAARGRHARTASGAHARARTLRAVPQITVCGCGPQPECRPARPTPRSNASKSGSARGLRQDPTFVCESGGRQPACPLGLRLAGQESVRRRTRAREQCCRFTETVPRGAGNRLDASRARPPSSAVVPKVTLWFLMSDTMVTQYDRVSPESRAGRLNVSQTETPREHFSGG